MPDRNLQAATESSPALFDRYTLPKVALVVILGAALVGTWVTSSLADRPRVAYSVVKWTYFVGLGILTGGLVWKHLFVRPSDLGDGTASYCAEMYERFDRVAIGALVVTGLGGIVATGAYVERFDAGPAVVGYGGLLLAFVVVTALTTCGDRSVAAQFRRPRGVAALVLALSVVGATALLEVGLRTSGDPLAVAIRMVHLFAFAVWIGGAVWNIFVAVPTGQTRPTTAVVQAAGAQLERFRWAVRLIIPTLIVTGLYQAVDALGTSFGTYLGTVVGLAVVAKLGFIGLLVVIFKLCPMWRACSPIDGVCELDDLGQSTTGTEDTGVPGDD